MGFDTRILNGTMTLICEQKLRRRAGSDRGRSESRSNPYNSGVELIVVGPDRFVGECEAGQQHVGANDKIINYRDERVQLRSWSSI